MQLSLNDTYLMSYDTYFILSTQNDIFNIITFMASVLLVMPLVGHNLSPYSGVCIDLCVKILNKILQ